MAGCSCTGREYYVSTQPIPTFLAKPLSMAVTASYVMIVSSLIELFLVDHDMKNWQAMIPRDDQRLKSELLRSFLRYLGIEQKGG